MWTTVKRDIHYKWELVCTFVATIKAATYISTYIHTGVGL